MYVRVFYSDDVLCTSLNKSMLCLVQYNRYNSVTQYSLNSDVSII